MNAHRPAAIHTSYELPEDIGQQVGEQMEARVNRRRRRSADEHSPSQNAISRPAKMVKVAAETGGRSFFCSEPEEVVRTRIIVSSRAG